MTQLEEAKTGNMTSLLKKVAQSEGVHPEIVLNLIAQGKVIIPFNSIPLNCV